MPSVHHPVEINTSTGWWRKTSEKPPWQPCLHFTCSSFPFMKPQWETFKGTKCFGCLNIQPFNFARWVSVNGLHSLRFCGSQILTTNAFQSTKHGCRPGFIDLVKCAVGCMICTGHHSPVDRMQHLCVLYYPIHNTEIMVLRFDFAECAAGAQVG